MTALTKIDIAAFRAADTLCVHLNARYPKGLARLIKKARKSERDPFAEDVEHIVEAEVTMHGFDYQKHIESGRAKCFGHISFYHAQRTHASNVARQLRVGDEIEFHFWPDGHSNDYVRRAGLHADVLYMKVRRNGQTYTWELETSICEENTARMCAGYPSREERDAA